MFRGRSFCVSRVFFFVLVTNLLMSFLWFLGRFVFRFHIPVRREALGLGCLFESEGLLRGEVPGSAQGRVRARGRGVGVGSLEKCVNHFL